MTNEKCIYCFKECKSNEEIIEEKKKYESEGGNPENILDEVSIPMFGTDKPIHRRCLKESIIGAKYLIEDYPQLKNAVMLLCKSSKQLKDLPWSEVCK
jgi:hypothetical protein